MDKEIKEYLKVQNDIENSKKRLVEIIATLLVKGFSFSGIANALGKNKQAVWSFYRNNLKK